MKIRYEWTFEKDLKKINDKKIFSRIQTVIEHVKNADSPYSINNIKKLKSYPTFYRIRIGDYRIGLEIKNNELIFTRFLHRKEIYRFFP